jgi:predicted DNA binding CopG/RHH family protein
MKKSKKKKAERDPLAGDLSEFIREGNWRKVRFEFKPKNKTITLRISEDLLDAIKQKAESEGLDYQKWIRNSLEESLHKSA